MDYIDYKILKELKANAREKASVISEKIGLSVSTVIDRIRKMEDSGIISGYTVKINQKKTGNDMTALMEVSLEHPKYYNDFTEMIRNNPNIVDCYYLTGEFDFILKVITDSSDSLEMIHRNIKSMDGVSATNTHFVLKSVKNEFSILPNIEKD